VYKLFILKKTVICTYLRVINIYKKKESHIVSSNVNQF